MNFKSSVLVRSARGSDRDAVRRVAGAAFGDEGPTIVRLLDALEASGHAELSLVAEVDGVVVGHVQLNRCWLDARPALVDVLVLSPLSVDPDYQGRGIGGQLVTAALDAASSTDTPAVFLEGAPDFYGRYGFERASARGFVRPSTRIPDPAFQVAVLGPHEEWMTGALVYCDAFWALDSVGLRDPVLGELERQFSAEELRGEDAPPVG